jgi:dTDP-4-amino-4,6-dideoxygalactose transaminase
MRESANALRVTLGQLASLTLPPEPANAKESWWKFHFLLPEGVTSDDSRRFADLLLMEGVRAGPGFARTPLFNEPALRSNHPQSVSPSTHGNSNFSLPGDFPGVASHLSRAINLPWGPDIQPKQVRQIGLAIGKVLRATLSAEEGVEVLATHTNGTLTK